MSTFLKFIQKTVKHWYIPVIIGGLLAFVGIYILTVPEKTYLTLTLLFSLSFLVSGVLGIFFSIQNRKHLEGWGWYLSGGIFDLLIGVLLTAKPEISALTLPLFVGFSLLFRSMQGLGFAIELKNYKILNWGNLAISSTLGILFSFILIFNPVFAGISLVTFTSLSFLFSGISTIVLAFQLRKLKRFSGHMKTEWMDKMDSLRAEYEKHISDIRSEKNT